MFIAALFTIAKTWRYFKCLSIDDWIKEKWYVYTMGYYLATKKKKSHVICKAWTELEIIILSETRQKEEDRYI